MPCIDNGAGWDGCERHQHRTGRVDGGRRVVVSQASRDRLTDDLLAAAIHEGVFTAKAGPAELLTARPAALNPPTPDSVTDQLTRKEANHAGLYL